MCAKGWRILVGMLDRGVKGESWNEGIKTHLGIRSTNSSNSSVLMLMRRIANVECFQGAIVNVKIPARMRREGTALSHWFRFKLSHSEPTYLTFKASTPIPSNQVGGRGGHTELRPRKVYFNVHFNIRNLRYLFHDSWEFQPNSKV